MLRRFSIYLFTLVILGGCWGGQDVEWHDEDGYRWRSVDPGFWGEAGFSRLDSSLTGISFENRLTDEEIDENQHFMNGSGVAAGDVNGDGWTDLYFARLHGPNRLYLNTGGFAFQERTEEAGLSHDGHYSTSVVFADIDGDDDLDVLVGSMSDGITAYLNDGSGHFSNSQDGPFEERKGNMTLALADVDEDGDLDLYVANYKEKPVKDLYPTDSLEWEKTVRTVEREGDTEHELIPPFDDHYRIIEREGKANTRRETGERDALYLNDGTGTFRKIDRPRHHFLGPEGEPQGLSLDWGLNASFQDIDRDGHPDLYVNNDFWTPDRIWMNRGDGVFRAMDPLAVRNSSYSSMTVDFSDIDRDGHLDFFVTEMLSPVHSRRLRQFSPDDPFPQNRMESRPQYNRNSLYVNRGDGTFAEVSYFSGVEATEWSWGTRFLDVDLDGYDDLLVNTGFSYDFQDLDSQQRIGQRMNRTVGDDRFLTDYPRLRLENKSFQNGGHLRFSERRGQWGFGTEKDVSHGLVTADFDRDGDLDLAVSRLNDSALLFENQTTVPRIGVTLSGKAPNTRAVGATVALSEEGEGRAPQREEITAGGDYLSGSAPMVTFAAGDETRDYTLTVNWPDGTVSTIDSVRANRIYDVRQPDSVRAEAPSPSSTETSEPVFADVSKRIRHRHHESQYDDFRIQPLLPLKLSQQGPGISWIDYDGDGDDDLFVSSGRGGDLAVFESDGKGRFERRSLGPLTDTSSADQTTVLGWPTSDGAQILVGNANYEAGDPKAPSVYRYTVQDGSAREAQRFPGQLSTTGPLALADYDGDEDLDVFVGGRFLPARYPKDATSRLFENRDGAFTLDRENARIFDDIGLVTGAAFTDYDLDGDPDLLLSCEWGALRLLENRNGSFHDVSKQVGLAEHKGWWNGIATGDFNADGRPDVVATNWGLNSPYQLDTDRALKMYYRDFNRDGRVEIIEAHYEPGQQAYVPRRQLSAFESSPIPFTSSANSHASFANSSLQELLGANPERRLSSKEINTLAHTVFLNQDDGFSAHPLPRAAQFTAAFHAGVADYNADGHEDLFLSQNFFEVRPQTPRLDGGRGLLLRGNGTGEFEAVPGQESGIKVYGEQRGAAFGDFNGDARVDLAVTQNGAETRLFENRHSNSGIKVRLEGPPENRLAIGASVRLVYSDGTKGPRRTVQAGSGYWSQRSAAQILGATRTPQHIEVTWPDGQVETVRISSGKRTYRISYQRDGQS